MARVGSRSRRHGGNGRIPAENLDADTQRIPESVSDEEASFTEPLATVVKSLPAGPFRIGSVGARAVGLGTAGQLAAAPRGRPALCESSGRIGSPRAGSWRKSGAEETIEVGPGAPDVPALLGARRFDLVLVSPGKAEVARAWVDAVAPGGVRFFSRWRRRKRLSPVAPRSLFPGGPAWCRPTPAGRTTRGGRCS